MKTEDSGLDVHDGRILAELQRDARITMAELGRRVHLSQPAVTERVRKLELNGVIKGYRAVVDYQRLGYGIRAIVRVGRVEYARVVKLIEQTPDRIAEPVFSISPMTMKVVPMANCRCQPGA